ncbi:MAG TPA: hypothetical protein ENJ28_05830 [Gammaproteobacteria bacterium]|nr:hypothetical protein [Gammaproteobacteria bacterium]
MKNQLVNNNSIKNEESHTLISQALNDITALDWLIPVNSLSTKRSVEFGRQIENSLNQLTESQHIIKLRLRQSDKAVVLGLEEYQSILNMKQHLKQLVDRVRELELSQAGSQYDQLFQQITSPESRQASDTIFEMPDDALNQSLKD